MISKRHSGIDLLRILSMLMILTLHCIVHGKLSSVVLAEQPGDAIIWLIRGICTPAVNLYALISGYVCSNTKHRWERLAELWVQVWLTSVLAGLVFFLLHGIGLKELIMCFFPVLTNRYWYFSAYVLLAVAMPFLLHISSTMPKIAYRNTLIALLLFMCLSGCVSSFLGFDAYTLNLGYSFLWLSVMFLIGAYIRNYPEDYFLNLKKWKYLVCFAVMTMIPLLFRYVVFALPGSAAESIGLQRILYTYLSPTVTIAAISLFVFFSRLQIKSVKWIHTVSTATFGVYLLHDHFTVRKYIIEGICSKLANFPVYLMIPMMLMFALTVFLICTGMELMRRYLFRFTKMSLLVNKTVNSIRKILRTERRKKP